MSLTACEWRRGEFKGRQIDGKEELNLQHEVWGSGRLEGFTLILGPSMVVPQPMWGIVGVAEVMARKVQESEQPVCE